MKLFLKILGGIVIFFLLLGVGLNLYFTDERLKEMIVPRINETLDREVHVDRMSFTIFRTFPRFGLRIQGFMLPDDNNEPVAVFESLTAAVKLMPLFQNEISISRLDIDNPRLFYSVYADSTTNIDFLLDDEEVADEEPEAEYSIRIPHFNIRDADIFYRDATTETRINMEGLNAMISLAFSDVIESSVDVRLRSLSAWFEGEQYVSDLSLQLQQESIIDMAEELLTLSEGALSIRGLALNLNGSFSSWSSDAPMIELRFNSSSDNFGELLRLAPPEIDEQLQGLESRGSLLLEGSISGALVEEQIPNFELRAEVADGYLKNPDLQEPIRDIQFALRADNDRVSLSRFSAAAAENTIVASGELERPFDDDATFTFLLNGDIDLATIHQFYAIDQAGIETLSGTLAANAEGAGRLHNPEETTFTGVLKLSNGIFKYIDVPRPMESIEAHIEGTQDLVTIHAASFRASANRFSMSGSISEPMAELPFFDVNAELDFDLATIKDFYPIDEDTLALRGQLTARAILRGHAEQMENALQSSDIELRDGYIDHRITSRPLEDITFIGSASSSRLDIREARFRTGENRLSLSGTVDDYMGESPLFDLHVDGFATLADISSYYSLEPWISELTGSASMNLNARGPAGQPTDIALDGSLELSEVFASGDSLGLPVSNLEGKLLVNPESMTLESFFMNYGSSDFSLEGRLDNYLGFLREHDSRQSMPTINGSYHSRLLNMDEMVDWDEEVEEEPIPIELPQLTSSVTARIDSLILFGAFITNIQGRAGTTPDRILIEDATAQMYGGDATGRLIWNVPQPDYTNVSFNGNLQGLQVDAFFKEFPILGENSRFERHLAGDFSTEVDYYTELNEFIEPVISKTLANGSFGMQRARLEEHPLQERLADWLGSDELLVLELDEWTANFTIEESLLTLENFHLTSENIGIQMDGTQHLETDEIDFTATLLLPSRFRRGLSSVISSRAVDALTRDDGIIEVPIRISGTMENPRFSPRQSIIEDLLRDAGRDVIRGLFNRN